MWACVSAFARIPAGRPRRSRRGQDLDARVVADLRERARLDPVGQVLTRVIEYLLLRTFRIGGPILGAHRGLAMTLKRVMRSLGRARTAASTSARRAADGRRAQRARASRQRPCRGSGRELVRTRRLIRCEGPYDLDRVGDAADAFELGHVLERGVALALMSGLTAEREPAIGNLHVDRALVDAGSRMSSCSAMPRIWSSCGSCGIGRRSSSSYTDLHSGDARASSTAAWRCLRRLDAAAEGDGSRAGENRDGLVMRDAGILRERALSLCPRVRCPEA